MSRINNAFLWSSIASVAAIPVGAFIGWDDLAESYEAFDSLASDVADKANDALLTSDLLNSELKEALVLDGTEELPDVFNEYFEDTLAYAKDEQSAVLGVNATRLHDPNLIDDELIKEATKNSTLNIPSDISQEHVEDLKELNTSNLVKNILNDSYTTDVVNPPSFNKELGALTNANLAIKQAQKDFMVDTLLHTPAKALIPGAVVGALLPDTAVENVEHQGNMVSSPQRSI